MNIKIIFLFVSTFVSVFSKNDKILLLNALSSEYKLPQAFSTKSIALYIGGNEVNLYKRIVEDWEPVYQGRALESLHII